MTLQYDYFSHNIPNWSKILKKFKNKKNIKALEIGCFEGRATKWLLENILTDETSNITVIDTFKGSIEHKDDNYNVNNLLDRFKENIKEYNKKIKIYKGFSSDILRNFKHQKFDIIYIDGSHIAKDVLEDAVLSWKFLKKDGILIFDDYKWNFYTNPELCPKIAIDSFLEVYKNQYKIINIDYQVYLAKHPQPIKKKINTKHQKNTKNNPIELDIKIKKLEKDLSKIQSSKTYKLWQKYNSVKKLIFNKK